MKNKLCIILAALMSISLLTACGNQDASAQSQTSENTSTESTENSSAPPQGMPTAPPDGSAPHGWHGRWVASAGQRP